RVLDQLLSAALFEHAEPNSISCTSYQTHGGFVSSIVDCEGKHAAAGSDYRPVALVAAGMSSLDHIAHELEGWRSIRWFVENGEAAIWAAAPHVGGISVQEAGRVRREAAQHVAHGGGGGEISSQVDQTVAEASFVFSALAQQRGFKRHR